MIKKGDTLIEVTLAVGIFSMIAIAITSVMSGGTSSAQTALETTLAREEIDAQAEALRFIHSSYIADKDSVNQKYSSLWRAITDRAYTITGESETSEELLQFTPKTCLELYEPSVSNNVFTQKAFAINTRRLDDFTDKTLENVLLTTNTSNPSGENVFKEATTYPRIVYGSSTSNVNLLEDATATAQKNAFRVEGIYIVAVKEADKASGNSSTTSIVSGGEVITTPAFYDFYIRTCWYGSNAEMPSTISTVIRLYDPDAIDPDD